MEKQSSTLRKKRVASAAANADSLVSKSDGLAEAAAAQAAAAELEQVHADKASRMQVERQESMP